MIPVCIVSGYLGAGKTTLIREFLLDPGPWRACVLVNDFGKINLDAALIEETGTDTIALTNGCACCTIGDDLLAGMKKVVEGPVRYDLIIVEASGVSQPARIGRLAAGVPGTKKARCLTVVNMAKARQLSKDKFVGRLFHQQTDQADGLCLNRIGDGAEIVKGLLQAELPRFTSLQGFLSSKEQSSRLLERETDTGKKAPSFRQEHVHFDRINEESLRHWLLQRSPSVHRAKGYLKLEEAGGKELKVKVDYVQGSLNIVPLAAVDHFHDEGLVVISAIAG